MSWIFSLGVRQHLDGQFYSVVGWYATFDLVKSLSEVPLRAFLYRNDNISVNNLDSPVWRQLFA